MRGVGNIYGWWIGVVFFFYYLEILEIFFISFLFLKKRIYLWYELEWLFKLSRDLFKYLNLFSGYKFTF